MRGVLFSFTVVVASSGCSNKDDHPLLQHHSDAAEVDATLDAPPGTCATNELACDVTVACAGVVSHLPITLCDGSSDAASLEAKARSQAMADVQCTPGATFTATCTAKPTAFACPTGFELEDATVCLPGMTFDASTSDICGHLPATDDACGHACDRAALYPFATSGHFAVYLCTATDNTVYQVGAAPMTGDGAR